MKRNSYLILATSLTISSLLGGCSQSHSTAGVTSETTNGIISSVAVSSDGNAAVGAKVYIHDAQALLGIEDTIKLAAVTNIEGFFEIAKDDHPLDKTTDLPKTALIELVAADGNRGKFLSEYDTESRSYDLPKAVPLQQPSSLFGVVKGYSRTPLYVQMYGLERTVQVTDSIFYIDSLPWGDVSFRIITSGGQVVVERQFLDVRSGESRDAGIFNLNVNLEEEKAIVRMILDKYDLQSVTVESVTEVVDNHIYELKLDGLGVKSLPPEVAKLRLGKLSLARNGLTDLPLELGDMTTLEYLDLSGNGITELPEVIGRLSHLQALDIGTNSLLTLPESIVELKSLSWLYINHNYLNGLPPHLKIWVDEHSSDDEWDKSQKEL